MLLQKLMSTLLLTTALHGLFGQNIEGLFKGYYYETEWNFTLSLNGHYTWQTRGHFGSVTEHGHYERYGDTLLLYKWLDPEVFDSDHRIDHQLYVYSDSCLVDLFDKFDYCIIPEGQNWLMSNKRYLDYPQIPTTDSSIIAHTASLIQMALEWSPLCAFFDCDTDSTVPLYLLNYFELQSGHQPEITCYQREVYFVDDTLFASIPENQKLYIRDINFTPYTVQIGLYNHNRKSYAFIVFITDPTTGNYIIDEQHSSVSL